MKLAFYSARQRRRWLRITKIESLASTMTMATTKDDFFSRHMKNENAENGPHKTRKMPYLLLLKVNDFYANELLM